MSIGIKIVLIVIMTVSGSIGAFFFKRGTDKVAEKSIFSLIITSDVWLGGCFYVIGVLANVYLLRYIDYVIVYPMTALTYVWTLVIAHLFLHEQIEKKRIIAILLILFGVILIGI